MIAELTKHLLPVTSIVGVRAIHYDPGAEVLTVEFLNREIWQYPDVPARTWVNLFKPAQANGVFTGTEREARHTKKRIEEPESQLSVAERTREMRLSSEYGPQGSPTRTRYEDLQRQLEALPIVSRQAELAEVRASLAAMHPPSAVEEVEHLLTREAALQRIVDTAQPAVNRINAEIEAVREAFRREEEELARREYKERACWHKRLTRLAELDTLLEDRNAPHLDYEELRELASKGLNVRTHKEQVRAAWVKEYERLWVEAGLPTDEAGNAPAPGKARSAPSWTGRMIDGGAPARRSVRRSNTDPVVFLN